MDRHKLIISELKVELDKVSLDFKNHIEIPDNNKILFSGKYGTGKSFFLENFFENAENKIKYNAVTISPINYVISQNENIFELIKVDILKHLFQNKQLEFIDGDISFDKLTVVKEYLKTGPLNFVKHIAASLNKISAFGEETKAASEAALNFLEQFKKFEDALNKKYKPKGNVADEYVNELYEKVGSYLEFNQISEIIRDAFFKIKVEEKRENVLIIEDFDRLDPEHIFRILNIFSAHHTSGSTNKFGFDKVIIVCDIDNIKNLYIHKYGENVDFSGYIDKFYSHIPYHFDNKKAIYIYLKNKLKLAVPEYALNVLTELLVIFISDDIITLRKMMKTYFLESNLDRVIKEYYWKDFSIKPALAFPIHISRDLNSLKLLYQDVPLLGILSYLKALFGGIAELKIALEKSKKKNLILSQDFAFDLASTFAIPSKLNSEQILEHSKIFFSTNNGFQYPEHNIAGVGFAYRLNSSVEKHYDGIGSYFKDAQIVVKSEAIKSLPLNEVLGWIDVFLDTSIKKEWII